MARADQQHEPRACLVGARQIDFVEGQQGVHTGGVGNQQNAAQEFFRGTRLDGGQHQHLVDIGGDAFAFIGIGAFEIIASRQQGFDDRAGGAGHAHTHLVTAYRKLLFAARHAIEALTVGGFDFEASSEYGDDGAGAGV